MQDQTLGMIMPWPIQWAPTGWHVCDGSMLQIKQYTALYSLLGTVYGGDGINTFALPDLRSRVQVGATTAPKSTTGYAIGTPGGAEKVALTIDQLPPHTHTGTAGTQTLKGLGWVPVSSNSPATTPGATSGNSVFAQSNTPAIDPGTSQPYVINNYVSGGSIGTPVYSSNAVQCSVSPSGASVSLSNTGGGLGHNNIHPCLALNFIIAITGFYPMQP